MTKPFAETATLLYAAGYSPIPIIPGAKRPARAGWQRHCVSPLTYSEIDNLRRSPIPYGIGIALGFNGLVAIDIDSDDPAVIAAIREVLS